MERGKKLGDRGNTAFAELLRACQNKTMFFTPVYNADPPYFLILNAFIHSDRFVFDKESKQMLDLLKFLDEKRSETEVTKTAIYYLKKVQTYPACQVAYEKLKKLLSHE